MRKVGKSARRPRRLNPHSRSRLSLSAIGYLRIASPHTSSAYPPLAGPAPPVRQARNLVTGTDVLKEEPQSASSRKQLRTI